MDTAVCLGWFSAPAVGGGGLASRPSGGGAGPAWRGGARLCGLYCWEGSSLDRPLPPVRRGSGGRVHRAREVQSPRPPSAPPIRPRLRLSSGGYRCRGTASRVLCSRVRARGVPEVGGVGVRCGPHHGLVSLCVRGRQPSPSTIFRARAHRSGGVSFPVPLGF